MSRKSKGNDEQRKILCAVASHGRPVRGTVQEVMQTLGLEMRGRTFTGASELLGKLKKIKFNKQPGGRIYIAPV